LLKNHFGDTSHPEVQKAINNLAVLNPTHKSANSKLNLGDWNCISAPSFPGRIPPQPGQESQYKFTLGGMSFDIFEPNNLICTINSS